MKAELTVDAVRDWLVEQVATRLGVPPAELDTSRYFDEFGLESTEALVLAGELERWLGMEVETTAVWYHPTIPDLAGYIAEKAGERS
ncbi:acyl carrier protein [Kutzneria sp. CA-103260]|uniref:acyl carrier protein n=1 Tax=Kutzneria sp. CA-103260 TaxID=2802641 RepID=UPI001BA83F1E|nr:acyl carrier protein [Kutzneria sp. CA-103260]QUQ72485.1 polyketide synthase [Kutzneria sp. CA-103260]